MNVEQQEQQQQLALKHHPHAHNSQFAGSVVFTLSPSIYGELCHVGTPLELAPAQHSSTLQCFTMTRRSREEMALISVLCALSLSPIQPFLAPAAVPRRATWAALSPGSTCGTAGAPAAAQDHRLTLAGLWVVEETLQPKPMRTTAKFSSVVTLCAPMLTSGCLF